jgi:hypothetical protein
MTIYILIKPWDYSSADAMAFSTLKAAQEAKQTGVLSGEKNSEYWTIEEQKIHAPIK